MSSESLSEDSVDRTIDAILASERWASPDGNDVILRRVAELDEWKSLVSSLSSSHGESKSSSTSVMSAVDFRTPFYFGIQALRSDGKVLVGFCTFYIAYSTWDGRMLYVDQIQTEADGSILLYRVMAKIARGIDCSRFTWKQKDRPNWGENAIVDPEFLEDWIFLSMDRSAMANFVGSSSGKASSSPDDDDDSEGGKESTVKSMLFLYVEDTIREILEEQTSTSTNGSKVNLRLAGPEDTETIAGLVQQLAIYEKEPDAVNVTAEDYFTDGYNSMEPLFYCILADVETADGEVTTAAMGLFYIGHNLLDGPFVYLEDLFCDEAFRGKGIGTEIMKHLAQISLALDCTQFVWTALDWNAPALSFYKKIGATMKTELKITRYCGSELKAFAYLEPPT